MSSLSFKIEKPKLNQRKDYEEFHSSDSDEGFTTNKSNQKKKIKLELIDEFDSTHHQKKEENDFVIQALPNRDFRSIYLSKKSKKTLYKPDEGSNSFGKTHSQTNKKEIKSLENVDRMNSSNVSGGLKVNEKVERVDEDVVEENEVGKEMEVETRSPILTLEEQAKQELIKESGGTQHLEKKELDPILMPVASSSSSSSSFSEAEEDETSAFRKDVSKRPNPSTLEDYERVPVGSFGLALLKGMGWKEGTSASKNGRVGLLEAVVPKARPSLLGIGAKPLVVDEGAKGKARGKGKEDRKYVPLIRKVIDPETRGSGSRLDSASRSHSHSNSRSRSPSMSRSSSYRENSPSRADKNKTRYLEDGARDLKGLRIEDREGRGGRKERDSERDWEDRTRRDDREKYREERRSEGRDQYDREDGRRRDGREGKYRDEREDGRRRDGRDGGQYRDERNRRDGRDDGRGMDRKNGKDEDRYRRSYDDEYDRRSSKR